MGSGGIYIHCSIHCGISRYKAEVACALGERGALVASKAELHLILDAPLGWALPKAEELSSSRKVIVSTSPCPEYRLELLGLGMVTLLEDVSVTGIHAALQGEPCFSPLPRTPLSSTERLTLRLIASDYSNDEIARLRRVETQTVKNTIGSIYQKLYLKTRLQAAHYYFGNWHLLRSWTPPPHVTLPEEMRW